MVASSGQLSRLARSVAAGAIALVVLGCTEPQRAFVEPQTGGADAGDPSSSREGDSSASTTSAGSSDSNGTSSSETAAGASSESSEGSPTTAATATEAKSCEAGDCPADEECRTYRAVSCDQADASAGCEVVNLSADTPCRDGRGYCDGEGACVVPERGELGASCEADEECGSGFCAPSVDGRSVCCDVSCDGLCQGCNTEGHCDATPASDSDCASITCDEATVCLTYPEPSSGTCSAFGTCATKEEYCVPTYVPEGESCGSGLVCNGRGACVVDCSRESGPDRRCTEECPCDTGEGACARDTQCLEGLVCTADAAAKLGVPSARCLPAHCVNDEQDAEETSVDCGGGCGCRATYEIVEISGVPTDAGFGRLYAMSGDGSAFAGDILRDTGPLWLPYPARIDARGVVTELQGFGASGSAYTINRDGTVLAGDLGCTDPPDCTETQTYRPFRWIGNGEPTVVYYSGTAQALSATGNIVAGVGSTGSVSTAFRSGTNRYLEIPQLNLVTAMSADGEYIAGRSVDGDYGALWSATVNDVLSLDVPGEWTSWSIDVMSDDGSVFAGDAYTGQTLVSFLWKSGQFYELPKLPGADYNQISGMSSDGRTIAGLSGTNAVQRAFLWDEDNGIRTVIAETAARGLELPVDLEIIGADYLSDDGLVLVGWMYGDSRQAFWRVTLTP